MSLTVEQQGKLLLACSKKNLSLLKKIFKAAESHGKKIDVNEVCEGKYLIIEAVKSKGGDCAKIINFLLSQGAKIDVVDQDSQQNALMIAIEKGHLNTYSALTFHMFHTLDEASRNIILGQRDKLVRDALAMAIYIKHVGIVKDLLRLGADPNARYANERTPLILSVLIKASEDLCRVLIAGGADISTRDVVGHDALGYAIFALQENIAILLVDSGASIFKKNKFGKVPLALACKSEGTNEMKGFLRKYLTAEGIDFVRKIMSFQDLLSLMYSQDSWPGGVYENISNIRQIISGAPELVNQTDFLTALDQIESGREIAVGNNRIIQAMKLPYDGHAAYCVIEYENKTPKFLHYCDGNLLLSDINLYNYGSAVVSYAINPALFKSAVEKRQGFLKKVGEAFSGPPVYCKDARTGADVISCGNLKEVLRKLVVLDARGNPDIVSSEILTRKQERGNCSIKSLNILLRFVLSRINPGLSYDIDADGKPCGAGYEYYKEWKKLLIQKCLDNLIEATKSDEFKREEEPAYSMLLDGAKKSFLQAASKNNTKLLAQLKEILEAKKVNIGELKNDKGKNALHIAAKSGKVEALEWCLKNGIKLDSPSELNADFFIYISRDAEMLKTFVTNYPDLQVNSKFVLKIAENLAKNKSNDVIQILLDRGFDPKSGENILLNEAMSLNNTDLVMMLLQHEDFDVKAKDKEGFSILLWAADEKSKDSVYAKIIEIALDRGADFNAVDGMGSALTRAAMNGNLKVAELLLKKINQSALQEESRDDDLPMIPLSPAQNPMDIAIRRNDEKMIKLLSENGIKPSVNNKSNAGKGVGGRGRGIPGAVLPSEPLTSFSAYSNSPQLIKSLLAEGLAINVAGALIVSIENNNKEMQEVLIAHIKSLDAKEKSEIFATKNENDRDILALAIDFSNVNLTQKLLEAGANPLAFNGASHNALCRVILEGRQEIAMALLSVISGGEADLNIKYSNGETALMLAAKAGQVKICEEMIMRGADPLLQNDSGHDALALAILNGQQDAAVYLAPFVAKYNLQYQGGDTALMIALKAQQRLAYRALLEKGANPMVKNQDGNDLLSLAIIDEQEWYALELIRDAYDLNSLNKLDAAQRTPLMNATLYGRVAICEALLSKGVDVAFRNDSGTSALDIVIWNGRQEIAILLAKSGVDLKEKDRDGLTYLEGAAKGLKMDLFLAEVVIGSVKDYKQAVFLETLLGLLYSQDEYPGFEYQNLAILKIIVSEIPSEKFPQKQKFLEAFTVMQNKQYQDDKKVQIIKLPYEGHAAFGIIEYDESGIAQTLSICDGNLPLSPISKDGRGFGRLYFAINPEIAAGPPFDFAQEVTRVFGNEDKPIYNADGSYNLENLNAALLQIVKCDNNGKPEIIAADNPVRPQNRGNCSMKSINIVLREVLGMMDPSLTFRKDDENGKPLLEPGGPGYELYKEYKDLVIKFCLEGLVELANGAEGQDPQNSLHSILIDAVKSSFLQTASKISDQETGRHALSEGLLRISELKKILVREKINLNELVNSKGENVIFIAAKSGNVAAFKWCLENKIEIRPNNDGQSFLEIILENDNPKTKDQNAAMLDLLSQHNPDISALIESKEVKILVENATMMRRGDVVKFFLDSGFDPNYKFEFSESAKDVPLAIYAANYGAGELVDIFLQNKKFDVNAKDPMEMSILHSVASATSREEARAILKIAVEKGAKIDEKDAMGNIPLTYAILFEDLEMVKLLVQKDLAYDWSSFSPEQNPLNIAAEVKNAEIVQYLLQCGAKISCDENEERYSAKIVNGNIGNLLRSLQTAPSAATRPKGVTRLMGLQLGQVSEV